MEEEDEFLNFEERRPVSRLDRIGISNELVKMERNEMEILDRKERVSRAKDKLQDRMANMSTFAADALEQGLQDEDPGIRMKALAMYLDRWVPRVGIKKEEDVVEVVDEGKKLSLEEIEIVLRKKGMIQDAGSDSE